MAEGGHQRRQCYVYVQVKGKYTFNILIYTMSMRIFSICRMKTVVFGSNFLQWVHRAQHWRLAESLPLC